MRLRYLLYTRLQGVRRAYYRRFYCPYWDHKPAGSYGWSVSYIGKWDKQAAAKGTCENCGDVIKP